MIIMMSAMSPPCHGSSGLNDAQAVALLLRILYAIEALSAAIQHANGMCSILCSLESCSTLYKTSTRVLLSLQPVAPTSLLIFPLPTGRPLLLLITLENMAHLRPWLTCYQQRSRREFRYRTITLLGMDLYRMKIAGTVLSEDDKSDPSRACK